MISVIVWLLFSVTEIVRQPTPSPVAMAKYDKKAIVVIKDVMK